MVSSTSLATQCRVVLYGDNCVVCVRDTLTVYDDDLCYGQYTGKLRMVERVNEQIGFSKRERERESGFSLGSSV